MTTTNQRLFVLALFAIVFAPGCIVSCDEAFLDSLGSELGAEGSRGQAIEISNVLPPTDDVGTVTLHGAPNTPFYDLMIVLVNSGDASGQVEALIPVGMTDENGDYQAEFDAVTSGTLAVLLVRGFDRSAIGDDGYDLDPDDDGTFDVPVGEIIDEKRTGPPVRQ